MQVPPTLVAFAPPLAFSCLDAMAAYQINVVGMSLFQVQCVRNTIASAVLMPYIIASGVPHAPLGPMGTRPLLWARGVLNFLVLVLVYSAETYLTLSEFSMVLSCSPFPTALLCWLLVRERFTLIQGWCCILSIAGVLLITGQTSSTSGGGLVDDHLPSGVGYKLIGLALAVPSLVLMGLDVVIMRVLGDRVAHTQVLATMSIAPAILSGSTLILGQIPLVWPSKVVDWTLLLGMVPVGWFGTFTVTYAAQRLSGVTVIMTTYTGLVYSTAIQLVAYGNHPGIVTTSGMLVIVVAGIVAAVYGQSDPDAAVVRRSQGKEIGEEDDGDGGEEAWTDSNNREDSVPLLQRDVQNEMRV